MGKLFPIGNETPKGTSLCQTASTGMKCVGVESLLWAVRLVPDN